MILSWANLPATISNKNEFTIALSKNMRRFFIVLILCMMLPAAAQDTGITTIQVPVQCLDTKTMLEILSSRYNERPVFLGNSGQAWFLVTANERSRTWSMLAYTKETACVFGTGTGYETGPRGPTI